MRMVPFWLLKNRTLGSNWEVPNVLILKPFPNSALDKFLLYPWLNQALFPSLVKTISEKENKRVPP